MALSRVTTWSAGNVLTASALNGEFNNILNNALSLISPLTGNLSAGGFIITNLGAGSVSAPSLSFSSDSNTGVYRAAADIVALTAGGVDAARFQTVASGVNYHDFTPAATTAAPSYAAAGSDTNIGLDVTTKGTGNLRLISAGAGNVVLRANSADMLTVTSSTSVGMGTNKPFIPAAVSGTPAQHALYQENVPKVWANVSITPTLNDSFNMTSVADGGSGIVTITYDRDFASANYAVVATAHTDSHYANITSLAAGSATVTLRTDGNTPADQPFSFIAIGDQ
jgi:hypothetical protein